MNYNFTDRTRKVLAMAREEAIRLQHDYVGTEHILLGLVREGEGVAAFVLRNLNVDFGQIREHIEASVRKGHSTLALGELPYTSRAKKVLEYAMREAGALKHSYVGTEHLLIGLLCEEKAIAAQVLKSLGLSLAQARAEMLRVLGSDAKPTELVTERVRRPLPSTERLLRQLEVTYQGPSWHGPTLRELLADVSAEQAARRGIAAAHSIWEIVLHSTAWKRVVAERLEGAALTLEGEADWPPVTDTGAAAWQTALAELDAANEAVIVRVRELADVDLDRAVPGQNVSVYATVHGAIQHDIYHAGQVALLKKTLRA